MGNHDRSRWTTRAAAASLSFMCMVPTASAFRLSDFMLITSTQVPLGCILAYNNQISGCTARDFTKGSAGCSTACVDGINRIQYTLQAVCGDVSEPATTILGQALLEHNFDKTHTHNCRPAADDDNRPSNSIVISTHHYRNHVHVEFDFNCADAPCVGYSRYRTAACVLTRSADRLDDGNVPTHGVDDHGTAAQHQNRYRWSREFVR
ncbi:hypothetical protein B0H66DRAFT_601689 [Apodospora peruviana]|uniref:Uncharacterized protein n=1 Tax=Apodospora peruviana TaxID=516989 RepID=A0AAE0IBR9_9PEZI|nr:hypothetical protein B0H66DRAFT_601689 [Apodospora peruviana]